MKIVMGAFFALSLLTTGAALTRGDGETPPDLVITSAVAADGNEHFSLIGPDATCRVSKGLTGEDGHAAVVLGASCDAIVPGLSAATDWAEDANGTLALAAGNRTLARFTVADGAAYESFQPSRPPMLLSAD